MPAKNVGAPAPSPQAPSSKLESPNHLAHPGRAASREVGLAPAAASASAAAFAARLSTRSGYDAWTSQPEPASQSAADAEYRPAASASSAAAAATAAVAAAKAAGELADADAATLATLDPAAAAAAAAAASAAVVAAS